VVIFWIVFISGAERKDVSLACDLWFEYGA
jgi:hypothetical protein